MKKLLVLCSLFLFSLTVSASAEMLQRITGGQVQVDPIATGITTNTTTSVSDLTVNGNKTFYGEVVCTAGACTQTQEIRGTNTVTAANGVLICTITLSGTPRDQAACAPANAAFKRYYVVTTNTTGTAATGGVYVNY